jgi:hypothetical protein
MRNPHQARARALVCTVLSTLTADHAMAVQDDTPERALTHLRDACALLAADGSTIHVGNDELEDLLEVRSLVTHCVLRFGLLWPIRLCVACIAFWS